MGRPQIGIIGFGKYSVNGYDRVPFPPQRITTGIDTPPRADMAGSSGGTGTPRNDNLRAARRQATALQDLEERPGLQLLEREAGGAGLLERDRAAAGAAQEVV